MGAHAEISCNTVKLEAKQRPAAGIMGDSQGAVLSDENQSSSTDCVFKSFAKDLSVNPGCTVKVGEKKSGADPVCIREIAATLTSLPVIVWETYAAMKRRKVPCRSACL